MPPPKVDSAETHVYNTPSHLSPTCIHIVGGDLTHILNSEHVAEDEIRE